MRRIAAKCFAPFYSVKKFLLPLLLTLTLCVACGNRIETRTNPTDNKLMVRVPAGDFKMGISEAQIQALVAKGAAANAFEMEKPEHTVNVGEFWIDRDLVTNAEYKKFLDSDPDRPVPDIDLTQLKGWAWDAATRTFPAGRENFPVVLVDYADAAAYCQWAGNRLPTEAEWEKAARGADGRMYPWGSEWANDKTAFGEKGATDASPVGSFPSGASPYGANDMVGNVWQWTGSILKGYPYVADDGRQDPSATAPQRVVRGGMFGFGPNVSRASTRNQLDPTNKAISVGIRCAAN